MNITNIKSIPNIYNILNLVALVTNTNPATIVNISSMYETPKIICNGFNFYG